MRFHIQRLCQFWLVMCVWGTVLNAATFLYQSDTLPISAPIIDTAFNGDGQLLAVATSPNEIIVVDMIKKNIKFRAKAPTGYSHLRFSKNGQFIAFTHKQTFTVWNLNNNKVMLQDAPFGHRLHMLTFSNDSRYIAVTGSDLDINENGQTNTIYKAKIWNIFNKSDAISITQRHGPITSVAFHPNNQEFVTASTHHGNITRWQRRDGKKIGAYNLKNLGNDVSVHSITYAPKGQTMAIGTEEGLIYIYDRDTNVIDHTLQTPNPNQRRPVTGLQFDKTGRYLLSAPSPIYVWSTKTFETVATLPYYQYPLHSFTIARNNLVTIRPKMPYVGTIPIWDLDQLEPKQFFNTKIKDAVEFWAQRPSFETPDAYQKRQRQKNHALTTIMTTHIQTHRPLFSATSIRQHYNREKRTLTIRPPIMHDITFHLPSRTFEEAKNNALKLRYTSVNVEWQDHIGEFTNWKPLRITAELPASKQAISYTATSPLPTNTSGYPSLKKHMDTIKNRAISDPQFQAQLALIYWLGEGTAKDNERAIALAERSANREHPLGMVVLARILDDNSHEKMDTNRAEMLANNAFDTLKKMAETTFSGDISDAVAWCYKNGKGTPKNLREYYKWTKKAAEQRQHRAQYRLGYYYENGIGYKKHIRNATHWYTNAANQGNPDAQFALGRFYTNGSGVKKSKREALSWFHKSASGGHTEAQYIIGKELLYGDYLPKNPLLAKRWLEKAAKKNHQHAKIALGFIEEHGLTGPKNLDLARKWYLNASPERIPDAAYALATLYANEGPLNDPMKAQRWYMTAIDLNHSRARFDYARSVLESDPNTAWMLIKKSADDGLVAAQRQLAQHMIASPNLSRQYYLKAAKTDPMSQFELGQLLIDQAENNEALNRGYGWILRAAHEQIPNAQFVLGNAYNDENNYFYNPKIATIWLKKAAESMHPTYARAYADLLDQHKELGADINHVMTWLTVAANGGNAQAQLTLSRYYSSHPHIAPQPETATYWLKKAVDNQLPEAQLHYAEMLEKIPTAQPETILSLIKQSAEKNHPRARMKLSEYYLSQSGIKKNRAAALRLLLGTDRPELSMLDKDTGLLALQKVLGNYNSTLLENTETETLVYRGLEGYINGLTRVGTKQIRQQIKENPMYFYMNQLWHIFLEYDMPSTLAGEVMIEIKPEKEREPDFWILAAHLYAINGYPNFSRRALKKAESRIGDTPPRLVLDLIQIIYAVTFALENNDILAMETLYEYGAFDTSNAALINYINHWGRPLLKNKQQCAFVTSIPEDQLVGSYHVFPKKPFYDIETMVAIDAVTPENIIEKTTMDIL